MTDDLVERLLYLTEDLHNRGELDYSDLTSRAKARIEDLELRVSDLGKSNIALAAEGLGIVKRNVALEAALRDIVGHKFIDCGCYSIACEALGVECKI